MAIFSMYNIVLLQSGFVVDRPAIYIPEQKGQMVNHLCVRCNLIRS